MRKTKRERKEKVGNVELAKQVGETKGSKDQVGNGETGGK